MTVSIRLGRRPAAGDLRRGPGPDPTVAATGDLDAASLAHLRSRLDDAAARGARTVRLDVSAVARGDRAALVGVAALTRGRRGPRVDVVGVRWGQFLEVLAAEPLDGFDELCHTVRALRSGPPATARGIRRWPSPWWPARAAAPGPTRAGSEPGRPAELLEQRCSGWTLHAAPAPGPVRPIPLDARGAGARATPAVAQAVAVRVLAEFDVAVLRWGDPDCSDDDVTTFRPVLAATGSGT